MATQRELELAMMVVGRLTIRKIERTTWWPDR